MRRAGSHSEEPASESVRAALNASYTRDRQTTISVWPDLAPGQFRLSVDLPVPVADQLDELISSYNVGAAEVVRSAISTELLLDRAEREGARLVLERRGRRYKVRRRKRPPTTPAQSERGTSGRAVEAERESEATSASAPTRAYETGEEQE